MYTNHRRSPLALAAALSLGPLATGSAVHAGTYSFIGGTTATNTNWDTSTNWSPAAVPGTGDTVNLPVTSFYPTKTGGTINVATINMSNNAHLSFSTNLTLSANVNFPTTGSVSFIYLDKAVAGGTTLTIASGATLSGRMSVAAPYGSGSNPTALINNGTISATVSGSDSYVYGTVSNNGTIQAVNGANLSFGQQTLNDSLSNNNGGIFNVSGGGKFFLTNSNTVTNNGTINVSSGSTFVTSSILTTGGAAGLTNNGTVNIDNGIFTNDDSPNGSALLGGSGTYNFNNVALSGGGTLTLGGTAKYYLDGTTSSTSSQALTVSGGATLGGSGTLASTITVSNTGGTVSPGHSPGTFSIGGNYTQGAGGNMLIEIGGTTAGTGYDVLNVGGTATLGGTLTVSFVNGFQPTTGQVFNFFNATGTTTGSFSSIVYQNAPGGDTFSVSKNGNSFQVNTINGAAAPEPAALALLLPALPTLAGGIRRRTAR